MSRCLFVSEILDIILEFTWHYGDSLVHEEGPGKIGKRTLASIAQTCRAFSSPALDQLWMRLDSLDPLIKLFPGSMCSQLTVAPVRTFMAKKHWARFREYAVRIKALRGPGRDISASAQYNVVTTLARLSKPSLPLLPNLTELSWMEPVASRSVNDATIRLIQVFAGPRITCLTIIPRKWPRKARVRTLLSTLPSLCPNVTLLTFTMPLSQSPRFEAFAQYLGDVVREWPRLQALQTVPLISRDMEYLTSLESLKTLILKIGSGDNPSCYVKLPDRIHSLFMFADNASSCLTYLRLLEAAPRCLSLRVGVPDPDPQEMEEIFRSLSTHFDVKNLHCLEIQPTRWFPEPPRSEPLVLSLLTEAELASLNAFSQLCTLDLSFFCSSVLDDAAYARMAATWPELRCLKVGTADGFKGTPTASVGAVIAVLRLCPHLHTLHVVFDGSIPPPRPTNAPDDDSESGVNVPVDGREGCQAARLANGWGVSNGLVTEIYVGHSPIGEDVDGWKKLASCLGSVMPRLGRIGSAEKPLDVAERWRRVQRLLLEGED